MTVICVTGTPGSGKTFYAKKIADALSFKYVDVKEVIKKNKLDGKFDKKRDCNIIDTKKLNEVLIKLKGDVVIDSHLSHYLLPKFVDYVVVVKCELKELKKRLEERGYSNNKIRENLDCEIFDICLTEAMESGHEVFIIENEENFKQFICAISK
jgi:adenylate kinase